MRVAIVMGVALLGLGQAGCPACFEEQSVTLASFEGCEGTCGFEIYGDGEAWVAPTVHPGENGLFLVGEMNAVAAVDVDVDMYAGPWPMVELVSSCADDLRLAVDQLATDSFRLTITLSPGPASGPIDYYPRVSASLPNLVDEDGITEIDEVRVVVPSGGCVVDEIRIVHPESC